MTKFKHIFDNVLRAGDPVIDTTTESTWEFVSEYESGLTAVVKYSGVYTLKDVKYLKKFRILIFFAWISRMASLGNKKLSRLYAKI